jgi:glycosyltransferase involved in cell wall biosynthesis
MDKYSEALKVIFWRTEFYGAMTGGGVAAMHRGMTNALNELGNKSIYVSSGEVALPDYVKFYHIPYSNFFRNYPEVLTLPYIGKSVRTMKKIIEIEQPDFLFQHHHDFTTAGTDIKKITGIPFFLHCDFIQQWTKKYWGKLYLEKLLRLGEEIQWMNADRIFTISSVAKDMMVNEYGVDESKIVVNPNGVNTDFFRESESDRISIRKELKIENKFVQGFSGTFGVYHGVEYLAQAVKKTVSLVPDSFFLFIGDGELKPQVQQIIKENNSEGNVYFTGLVSYHEVPAYLSACDVLHTPCINNQDSSDYFGSPTKLFEYMSMNLPVIATAVGQQKEVIEHLKNGFLINEKSPEEIALAIQTLSKDRALSVSLAQNARNDAVEKWDWKNNVTRIINEYKSIILAET